MASPEFIDYVGNIKTLKEQRIKQDEIDKIQKEEQEDIQIREVYAKKYKAHLAYLCPLYEELKNLAGTEAGGYKKWKIECVEMLDVYKKFSNDLRNEKPCISVCVEVAPYTYKRIEIAITFTWFRTIITVNGVSTPINKDIPIQDIAIWVKSELANYIANL